MSTTAGDTPVRRRQVWRRKMYRRGIRRSLALLCILNLHACPEVLCVMWAILNPRLSYPIPSALAELLTLATVPGIWTRNRLCDRLNILPRTPMGLRHYFPLLNSMSILTFSNQIALQTYFIPNVKELTIPGLFPYFSFDLPERNVNWLGCIQKSV